MMDLTGFDLNLLRVFVAIAKERSVTRAGEQIAMSQPAVSAALHRLRYVLDDQLFVRRGNDMVPTPRAELLIGPVQDALERLQAALQVKRAFDPAAAQRICTILGADFFFMLLMPALSARLATLAPGIRAMIPRRFAEAFAPAVDVGLYRSPVDMPAPEIQMYWHSRHDRDPAHRWLRSQIVDTLNAMPG